MKQFTPIAMRCTQEQFEAIKPKLKGCEILEISSFKYYNYLTNCFRGQKNEATNISENTVDDYNRTVHEEWNEEVFLKACGIEVEKPKTKENVFITLQGRSKEEITDLWNFLNSVRGEDDIDSLNSFVNSNYLHFHEDRSKWWSFGTWDSEPKQEITISELKQILRPSLKQQLKEAQAEVKRIKALINEEHKIKIGDWVISANKNFYQKITVSGSGFEKWKKVTDPTLIKLLEEQLNK